MGGEFVGGSVDFLLGVQSPVLCYVQMVKGQFKPQCPPRLQVKAVSQSNGVVVLRFAFACLVTPLSGVADGQRLCPCMA